MMKFGNKITESLKALEEIQDTDNPKQTFSDGYSMGYRHCEYKLKDIIAELETKLYYIKKDNGIEDV